MSSAHLRDVKPFNKTQCLLFFVFEGFLLFSFHFTHKHDIYDRNDSKHHENPLNDKVIINSSKFFFAITFWIFNRFCSFFFEMLFMSCLFRTFIIYYIFFFIFSTVHFLVLRLLTQRLRTDLGRSVGVAKATQLVWLNRFTGSQPSNLPHKLWNQKETQLKICK